MISFNEFWHPTLIFQLNEFYVRYPSMLLIHFHSKTQCKLIQIPINRYGSTPGKLYIFRLRHHQCFSIHVLQGFSHTDSFLEVFKFTFTLPPLS